MALEPNFRWLDDLVTANPADTDDVSEGDDHLRGIKSALAGSVAGNDSQASLRLAGVDRWVATAGSAYLRVDPLSSNSIRLDAETGETLATLVRTGAALGVGDVSLRARYAGETLSLQVRNQADDANLPQLRLTAAEAALGYGGNDAAVTSFRGLNAYARAGDRGVIGLIVSDNEAADFIAQNAEGSFFLRADSDQLQVYLGDAAQGSTRQLINAPRLTGNVDFYNPAANAIVQKLTSAGVEVGNQSSFADGRALLRLVQDRPWQFQQAGTGPSAALHLISESNAKQFAVTDTGASFLALEINTQGNQALRSSSHEWLVRTDAFVADRPGAGAGEETFLVVRRGGTEFVSLRTDSTSQLGILQAGAGRSLQLESFGGNEVVFRGGSSRNAIYDGTEWRLGVPTSGPLANSYGTVKDAGNTERGIGFNVMPTLTLNANTTLINDHCGQKLRLNTAGITLTTQTGLVNDHTCQVWNNSNGDCTIAPGSGETLVWHSGAGKVSGAYTMPSGSKVTLTRRGNSTEWWI